MTTFIRIGLLSLAISFFGMTALAQQQPPDDGNGPPQRHNFDPSQFRQRMMDDLKQRLAMSDEDFSAIQPTIQKIMDLKRDTESRMRPGGPGGPGGFGGPGGPPQGGPDNGGPGGQADDQRPAPPPQSDVQKASHDLGDALDNPDVSSSDLKAKVDALRAARAKAREELAAAQQSLIQLVTPHQEAVLLYTGLLD